MSAWTDHVEKWKDCTKCPLHKQRFRICIARGTVPCDVLFIGEAPGASEDVLGLPFVGPAGRLMDQIIERALPDGMTYALTNLVCCFPRDAKLRGDNEPDNAEIQACEPRLIEFVNLAQPRLIVCVGGLAERWIDHHDTIPCIDIIHPAATFPPRMPRVQQTMALQKSVVVIRRAVEDMLQSKSPFTNWGNGNHASVASYKEQIERSLREAEWWAEHGGTRGDDEIPF